MCWSIIYHENKKSLDEVLMDYSIYRKVNLIENTGFSFQINKIIIQNKLYYNVTRNQCACDFFNPKNKELQNELIDFILKRMEIECVEPCILIKWVDDDNNIIDSVINKIIKVSKNNLLSIFTKEYKEMYYCIK